MYRYGWFFEISRRGVEFEIVMCSCCGGVPFCCGDRLRAASARVFGENSVSIVKPGHLGRCLGRWWDVVS